MFSGWQSLWRRSLLFGYCLSDWLSLQTAEGMNEIALLDTSVSSKGWFPVGRWAFRRRSTIPTSTATEASAWTFSVHNGHQLWRFPKVWLVGFCKVYGIWDINTLESGFHWNKVQFSLEKFSSTFRSVHRDWKKWAVFFKNSIRKTLSSPLGFFLLFYASEFDLWRRNPRPFISGMHSKFSSQRHHFCLLVVRLIDWLIVSY